MGKGCQIRRRRLIDVANYEPLSEKLSISKHRSVI